MSMFFLYNLFADDNREGDLKNNQPHYEIYVSFEPFAFDVQETMNGWQYQEERQKIVNLEP